MSIGPDATDTLLDNFIWAPNWGGHPDSYAAYTLAELKKVEPRTESTIRKALKKIGDEYARGTFNGH